MASLFVWRLWSAGAPARCALVGLAAALAGCALLALGKLPVRGDGDILVDANGMTLYTFDRDPRFESKCDAHCAAKWPPLLAVAGARPAGDFAIIARDDGRRQWAYKGKPLYLWSGDRKPGDRTGDGVDNLWRVARP